MTDNYDFKEKLKQLEQYLGYHAEYWYSHLPIRETREEWINIWNNPGNRKEAAIVWDIHSGIINTKLYKVLM